MFKLQGSKRFVRKYIKLVKRNKKLEKAFDITFDILAKNPSDKHLRSHKVIDVDGNKAFSSRVTGDIRIIWHYAGNANGIKELQIISLIDVGGHEGGKKVYK